MVARGAHAIARLSKRNVEGLFAIYDADPVAALTIALRRVLDQDDATWPELLASAPITDTRRAALLVGEQGALDALAAQLNELRSL
ncbi:MAG: hypothetical protein ABIR32_21810 [Ilumatobacteraceae bacterium]